MRFRAGGITDVGRMRSANEDSLLLDDEHRVFAVADGMGGHQAGDVASQTAIEVFHARVRDGDAVDRAVAAANHEVHSKAEDDPSLSGMGTTVTAVHIEGRVARFAHVGDSRAYLLRDGQLTQVTDDHSLVEELVREGRLSPDEAATHPQRSIITRALGIEESVDVDTYEIDLRPGDRVLLCSDGLTSMMRDEPIEELLRAESDPDVAARRLVDAANEAGGDDVVTVVVVDAVGEDGDDEAEATRAAAASDAAAGADAGEATGEWVPPDALREEHGAGSDATASAATPASPESPAPRDSPEPPGRRWRRFALWAVPVLVVVVVAVTALGWYARRTYFVGLDGEQVAVFQGVPGGFLAWDPTVEERSELERDDLTPSEQRDLDDGHQFSDRSDAEAFLERLERKHATTTTTSTTSSTATTSTTSAAAP